MNIIKYIITNIIKYIITNIVISISKSSSLKNKNGNLLTKLKEIKLRWKEYIEELYAKQDKQTQIKIENEV